MSSPPRRLRTHQAQTAAIVHAIASGQADEVTDILAAVTPGEGKSLLPSVLERRLRQRIGERVAQQAVEDEGAVQAPHGEALCHRYNAILKRRTGNKPRAEMSLAELEAAASWLERNRLADHAEALEGNPRYGWTLRQRGEWPPPLGRTGGRPRGALKLAARPTRPTSWMPQPTAAWKPASS